MNSLTIHNRKNHVEIYRRKTGEKMNEELELYKLLCTKDNNLNRVAATEIRWEKEAFGDYIDIEELFPREAGEDEL